jgi:hypothetical protein
LIVDAVVIFYKIPDMKTFQSSAQRPGRMMMTMKKKTQVLSRRQENLAIPA